MARERRERVELEEDRFVEAITGAYEFLRGHSTLITIVVAVLAVALIGFSVYSRIEASREASAALAFSEAMKLFQEAEDSWADEEKMDEAAKKYEEAREKFQEIADKYGRTSYAEKALFFAGKCSLQLGEYDKAIEIFGRLASRGKSFFALYAQQALGKCFEEKGDLKAAIAEYDDSKYERFKDLPEYGFTIAEVLMSRARCRERLGEIDGAISDYERLVRIFEANLRKAVKRKSAELIEGLKSMMKEILKESPPSERVSSILREAESLERQGMKLEALKGYVRALREFRAEGESKGTLPLSLHRRITRALRRAEEFLRDLRDGDEKLAEGRISSALSSYDRAVGLTFPPGRDLFEKASLKLRELKGLAASR